MAAFYPARSRQLLLALSILLSGSLHAQNLRTDGQRIVNDKNENVVLRGMGLGGWMLQEGYMLKIYEEGQQYRIRQRIEEVIGKERTEEFYNAWLANHTRRADVDAMAAWGFNSIRLPMHYALYTLPVDQEPEAGKDTWIEIGFAITDSLLAWCKANKIYLILDLHAAPNGQGNDLNISDRDPSKPVLWESKEAQRKTIALWRKLAERYAKEEWIGAYDVLNEPNWGFTDPQGDRNGTKEKNNAPVGQFQREITEAIRAVDKKHIVIIEGNGWGNNYAGFDPDWDKNMALSFHKYWNYNDSASISNMVRMRTKYNLPVWLGETGENSNTWFTDAIRLFETNNIGWAWWPLKKIGINNPMEIVSNKDYDSLVSYINKRPGSVKPDPETTYKGLMALAEAAKFENTITHRDVIDAMFRQPHTDVTLPYEQRILGEKSVLRAVDYDLGRNRFAYYDLDTANFRSAGVNSAGNRGRQYRNDGVDIREEPAKEGAYVVTDIEAGEWLQYTVEVPVRGEYRISLETAATGDSGLVVLENVTRKSKTAELIIPSTGSEKEYKATQELVVTLDKGAQVLRIRIIRGGFNLRSIQLQRQCTGSR
ncbi:MAG: carbohydrate-binding protein [Chitinophagaceae bacterium]|nr:MAG: carbohydrate-binding protein [Chitinophagaceae bacterium]